MVRNLKSGWTEDGRLRNSREGTPMARTLSLTGACMQTRSTVVAARKGNIRPRRPAATRCPIRRAKQKLRGGESFNYVHGSAANWTVPKRVSLVGGRGTCRRRRLLL